MGSGGGPRRPGSRGSLLIIGTLGSRQSALHLMLTAAAGPFRSFRRRLYRAFQEDGSSLWEARYPGERLKLQKRFMGRTAFNRQKLNEPPPEPEQAWVREEWIHYYHPDVLQDRELTISGFFESSLTGGEAAGQRAVVTVGWDRRELVFYVMEAFIRWGTLEAAWLAVLSRQSRSPYDLLGVADVGSQGLLLKELARRGRGQGERPPLKVAPHLAPETRLAALPPLLARGRIRFIRGHSDQELLVEQLLYYPSQALGVHGVEALAGAVALALEAKAPPKISPA